MFLNRKTKIALGATVLVASALIAPAAHAETKVDITGTMANPSPIGSLNNASITIRNSSTDLDSTGTLQLISPHIQMTGSCSTFTFPCDTPDPYVFFPDTLAYGRAGTACAGLTYQVNSSDPVTHRLSFAPDHPDTLAPPGQPGDTCIIDFPYTTDKNPAIDISPLPGVQTNVLLQAGVVNENDGPAGEEQTSYGSFVATVGPLPPGPPAPDPKPKCTKKQKKKHKKKCKRIAKLIAAGQ